MSGKDPYSEKPDRWALFWEEFEGPASYPSHNLSAIFFLHGFITAPVIGFVVGFLEFVRAIKPILLGKGFLGGWIFLLFCIFAVHWVIAALVALERSDTLARIYLKRHKEWLKQQAEMAEQHELGLAEAKYQAASRLLDELLAEAENRRLAPMREAQARTQRLATLELALEEAFNRYRFAHDVTGTADVNALRHGFKRQLQIQPPFSADDMALITTSQKSETRLLLSAPRA